MRKRYIVIGSSAAGLAALTRARKYAPDAELLCLTSQQEPPYNTCLLADFLAGRKTKAELATKPLSFFSELNITLHQETWVTELDIPRGIVTTHNGTTYTFDGLCLATGTTPLQLPFERTVSRGLFKFHTMTDTLALHKHLEHHHPQHAIIIGAGLSGVECADALAQRGITVTLIERGPTILPTLLDAYASTMLVALLEKGRVTVLTNTTVSGITVALDGAVTGVELASGLHIEAQIVITAIGARPATDYVAQGSLVMERGALVTNDSLQTSQQGIFAAGDIALVRNQLAPGLVKSCTWPDAARQGLLAGSNMVGYSAPYEGATIVLSSHFFGVQFVSCGPITTTSDHFTVTIQQGPLFYHKFVHQSGVLKGFLLVGKLNNIGSLRRYVTSQEIVPDEVWSSWMTMHESAEV